MKKSPKHGRSLRWQWITGRRRPANLRTVTNYTLSADGAAITCHRCGLTSHNPNDVANRFCGNCYIFHEPDHD